jgi:hypothetical protein
MVTAVGTARGLAERPEKYEYPRQNRSNRGGQSMKDADIKKDDINVQPPTDIAATALYNSIVSVASLEAQVLWQRYSVLLLANSVILVALNSPVMEAHPVLKVSLDVIGVLLCVLWWTLTQVAWGFWNTYSTMAARFRWPNIDTEVNVYQVMFDRFERKGEIIKLAAFGVIILFFAIYLALLIPSLL